MALQYVYNQWNNTAGYWEKVFKDDQTGQFVVAPIECAEYQTAGITAQNIANALSKQGYSTSAIQDIVNRTFARCQAAQPPAVQPPGTQPPAIQPVPVASGKPVTFFETINTPIKLGDTELKWWPGGPAITYWNGMLVAGAGLAVWLMTSSRY